MKTSFPKSLGKGMAIAPALSSPGRQARLTAGRNRTIMSVAVTTWPQRNRTVRGGRSTPFRRVDQV
jgi:hypothetical protein